MPDRTIDGKTLADAKFRMGQTVITKESHWNSGKSFIVTSVGLNSSGIYYTGEGDFWGGVYESDLKDTVPELVPSPYVKNPLYA